MAAYDFAIDDPISSTLTFSHTDVVLSIEADFAESKMGAQTRSSTSDSPIETQISLKSTAHEESQPLKLFILPKHISSAARFLLLTNPSDGIKKRFYFCPTKGLFEFRKVDAPTTDPRSILFTRPNGIPSPNIVEGRELDALQDGDTVASRPELLACTVDVAGGYVNKAAEVFVATPFDLVFILIPLLNSQGSSAKSNAGRALFQPLDDILESYLEDDKHFRYILETSRPMLDSAAAKICDILEAGDEKIFRLNEDKLFKTILSKAQNVINKALPTSMEDKFVKRALEKPMSNIKREESLVSVATEASGVGGLGNSFTAGDSQCSTIASAASATASEVSSTTMIVSTEDESIPDEITTLQRLRTAWSFITSSYLPSQLSDTLTEFLSSDRCTVDFHPLETYLTHLATLRAESLALRSLSGYGQKRGLDDGDVSAARAEKKRKQDEDEKRKKAGESRGVRDLKKVDISGMKKMSAFFTKTSTTKVKS